MNVIRSIIQNCDGNYGIKFIQNHCSNKYVIACHGFASHKESSTIMNLMEELDGKGIGVIAFDFPSHGESTVKSEDLNLDYCASDILDVYNYIKTNDANAEISIFGSSFGAYVSLLAIARYPEMEFKHIVFRCAAIDQEYIIEHVLMKEAAELGNTDPVPEGCIRVGFSGKVIPKKFLEQTKNNKIMEIYKDIDKRILFIHGDKDDVAPEEHVLEFINSHENALVATVLGADHRFRNPEHIKYVIDLSVNYFNSEE